MKNPFLSTNRAKLEPFDKTNAGSPHKYWFVAFIFLFNFHWANFNNEPINDWKQLASSFLSIPMAHQLIGFYTVADDTDGVLKVMRSYQFRAANKISDTVAKNKWEDNIQRGGYEISKP